MYNTETSQFLFNPITVVQIEAPLYKGEMYSLLVVLMQ